MSFRNSLGRSIPCVFLKFCYLLFQTDGVHDNDDKHPSSKFPEASSEAVKVLKGEYVIKAIEEQNMDQGLFVCFVREFKIMYKSLYHLV